MSRRLRLLSSSSYELAHHCTHFLGLDVPWEKTTGESARIGTAFHDACERWIKTGKADIDDCVVKAGMRGTERQKSIVRKMHGDWLRWLGDRDTSEWRAEIKIAYDPFLDVARELPHKGHRDYSAVVSGEIVGTADVVIPRGGAVQVIDWKTGKYANWPEHNPQVWLLSLAAARLFNAQKAIGTIWQWNDLGGAESPPYELNEAALETVRSTMLRILDDAREGKPNPGPWCWQKYCPAKKCPSRAERAA